MSMVTAIACTVTIATASKTKDRKTSRLHHEVWRKHRGLVEEDHVATIVSDTASETALVRPPTRSFRNLFSLLQIAVLSLSA